jgi:membrane-associated phospholipid phosphatase
MSVAMATTKWRLPAVTRRNLLRCLVAGYLVFCALYLGSAALAIRAPQLLEPSSLDRAAPFMAASIWVYLSQFVLLPYALASTRDDAVRSRAFYSMLVATAIAALVFMLFPTRVPQAVAPADGLLGLVWHALHLADTPNNAFPSLHVALAALAGATLWHSDRRVAALVWPALIAASALTTRQHVAWDVAGGLLLAPLAWFLTPRLIPYERTLAPDYAAVR